MKRTFCFLLLFTGICLSAQNIGKEPGGVSYADTDSFSIQIKYHKGYSFVDTLFRDNRASLDRMVSLIDGLGSNPLSKLRSISIKGSASPEGCLADNQKLAEKRAILLREYLIENTSLPSSAIKVCPSDIDWESLGRMIAATDLSWRDEAVSIIHDTPIYLFDRNNRIIDGKKNRLGLLRGGRAWKYMEKRFFPDMRNASVSIEYSQGTDENASGQCMSGNISDKVTGKYIQEDTVEVQTADTTGNMPVNIRECTSWNSSEDSPDTTVIPAAPLEPAKEISQEAKDRKFTVLMKTNMLYDIAAVPNIGIEIPIGKDWSVSANWMYAWWSKESAHRFWRVYGGDAEIRRWFSPRRDTRSFMCGHHIGVYGQMLTYDFEWGGTGYLGDKWSWGAGLSYGYSLPVGQHFNIDFTLGAGYLQGQYMKYHPEDNCYVWDSTHIRRWIGPTKAEISLVWFIGGRGERKGGTRR